ncbi:glycosyltransferase [Halalkalicoccus ordinarius]|uniref:glycosyltransferase n=1 Tax=Halalkalicoccus ordinarius TaxID=3116651 RepID=UPI00300EB192
MVGEDLDSYAPPDYKEDVLHQTLQDKNVLVISHRYNHFTKEQIDRIAKFVNEIHVYARYNRFTDLSRFIDSETLKKNGTHDRIAEESPENVYVHTTPLTYLPLDFWYRHLGRQHYRAVKRQVDANSVDFDLIHTHFAWTAGYAGSRLSEDLGIPCVTTIHENESRLTSYLESDNSLIHGGLRRADALIRVNKKDCRPLSKLNDSVYHIPNGYSRERYPLLDTQTAREQLGISMDTKVIFSLGALLPRKNFDMLIEAVSEIDSDENILCAIGGRGSEKERLESKMQEMDTDNGLELLGFIPEDRLHLWMNACDIFALSSNSEGNPTVLFEALGCGKPYVGTNVGGVDEVIVSEDYGLLCSPGETGELKKQLEKALQRNWNEAQILEYASRFTWESIAHHVCNVYVDSLSSDVESITKRTPSEVNT